jgi:hypothetical protein
MMMKKKPEPNAAKYELTSQERTAMGKDLARKAASPAPRLKVLNKNKAARRGGCDR